MAVISESIHQGLYNEANDKWIIYFNRSSNSIGLGTKSLISNNVVTIDGNAIIKNLLTVANGASHYGIKIGDTYINAINGDIIFQNNSAIRFGSDSWNWDEWAGLKYDCVNKYIYLGIADKNIFKGNNVMSGGRILTPGISHFHVGNQTNYYIANDGSIKASSITVDNNNSSGSIQLIEDVEGGTIRLYSKSNTYCYEIDAYNDETIRIHTASRNPNDTAKSISWNGKNGNVSADGTFYVQNTYPVMPMKSANGFYGIMLPDASDSDWIRTTVTGIIPYQSGGSSALGTESWPFNNIWSKTINIIDTYYPAFRLTAQTVNSFNTYSKGMFEVNYTDSIGMWIHSDKTTDAKSRRALVLYGWGAKSDATQAVALRQCNTSGTWLSDLYLLHTGNYNSYALPLAGGTMNGTIWSTHIYPKTTMAYNLGSESYEYNATFSRTIFVRHLEPAKNISNDIYLNYNTQNGCVRVYSSMSMEGLSNIVNLPIGGGIFWNPYVESATDGTDAASITLHANGVGGGTELRISMANDSTDVINLNPASWVYLKGKAAFNVSDSWLRINESSGFSSGIYTGSSLIRSDNSLQVGDSGSAFLARSDGYGKFSTKLDIGSKLSLWQDNEGGNIQIISGNGHTNYWQIDSYDGHLRLYTYRESDGTFQGNYFDQNTGYINNANYATHAGYTTRWDVTDSNPTTTSTDNCTSYFNKRGSHIYWYSIAGLINGQPSQYGYILDIGDNAERHQIWMTQNTGSLYHRGGNGNGWAADGWRTILDSSNYSSWTIPKSGGTFTGRVTISYAHTGGGMLHVNTTTANAEASISYNAAGTQYWVVGKGCGGTGTNFSWWYNPSGSYVLTLDSVGALTANGKITSKAVRGGMWIVGTHDATFVANTATTATAGNYYQGWYSGKTQSGAWSLGALSGDESLYFVYGTDTNYSSSTNTTASTRISSSAQVYGAVWNDYAEYRSAETIEPGRVVQESIDGIMRLTASRLVAGCEIISDTFGFAIGETKDCKTPVATSGRVLAYTFEDRNSFELGQAVCSGPNGTVSKMTREEIMMYPERIIGTVSEIPQYETWGTGDVAINGRIWIRVR